MRGEGVNPLQTFSQTVREGTPGLGPDRVELSPEEELKNKQGLSIKVKSKSKSNFIHPKNGN